MYSIDLGEKLEEKLERICKDHNIPTKSEFVREAIRQHIKRYETDDAASKVDNHRV
ncbi:MAG: ribbon-helix-helix domain-containing protein [Nitrospirota bacterium]